MSNLEDYSNGESKDLDYSKVGNMFWSRGSMSVHRYLDDCLFCNDMYEKYGPDTAVAGLIWVSLWLVIL